MGCGRLITLNMGEKLYTIDMSIIPNVATERILETPCGEILTCDECVQKMEKALRWRKWPEEFPNDRQIVLTIDAEGIFQAYEFIDGDYYFDELDITHWLPIPPMKEE